MKPDFKSMSLKALEDHFTRAGEEKYRARQVFNWISKGADSFNDMSNVPLELRHKLSGSASLSALETLKRLKSKSDGTRKYLFKLSDGNTIESVYMKYRFGNSVCVSSQAGCAMGCIFCASGKNGLARNLSPGEMADQIYKVQKDAGEKISRVVVMGTGEPFSNYENLTEFIKIINDKNGLNIGMRNITVSTSGIVPKIHSFAEDFPQVNLAVSLHGPNGKIRKGLMPSSGDYGELISACWDYTKKTGRRITFEYVLIDGKNDEPGHADELAAELRGMLCHVNLIPMNKVQGSNFAASSKNKGSEFCKRLEKKGVAVTLRRELGGDIDAACGQLRRTKIES